MLLATAAVLSRTAGRALIYLQPRQIALRLPTAVTFALADN
jgi:hypothetical protein